MVKNKARCPYGHFYNADRYSECPVCSPGAVPAPQSERKSYSDEFPVTELISNTLHPDNIPGTPDDDPEDQMTMVISNVPAGSEPVVGWLVCVKGGYFGQSFCLKAGNNRIGRAADMDVQLALEASVSRNRHCLITFDPSRQAFYIQQGDGRGITYLNGEIVMAPAKMEPGDRVGIGEAEFLFIPLCTGGFRWEDFQGEEKIK